MNLALFDLDHTLLPLDSDYEWGQFLVRIGAVEPIDFARRNADFFAQYQAGTLDPVEYLEFALGTLAQFSAAELNTWQAQFIRDIIQPVLLPSARELIAHHRSTGDLLAIVTATNRFITAPIATAFGIEHLLAAQPEYTADGRLTGRLLGVPSSGAGKLVHLEQWLAAQNLHLDSFERSYFYSDSHNDLPLLSAVTHPVATNPNALLTAHATQHGWPILHLFKE